VDFNVGEQARKMQTRGEDSEELYYGLVAPVRSRSLLSLSFSLSPLSLWTNARHLFDEFA
jgi:hypothetical protein